MAIFETCPSMLNNNKLIFFEKRMFFYLFIYFFEENKASIDLGQVGGSLYIKSPTSIKILIVKALTGLFLSSF